MIVVEREKDMTGKPMTDRMKECLEKVVRTNGGGVSYFDYPRSVWQGLINRGLVQGKLGNPARAVHTKLGLEEVRK